MTMAELEGKIRILLYPGDDCHGSLQPESLQVLVRPKCWKITVAYLY